jgi:HEAT repeat protein
MAKKSKTKIEFVLNEPLPKIKNGNKRKSIRVTAKEFPARAQRERLNGILLKHDLHTIDKNKLTAKDVDLLKQIAVEGTITNNIPALRYNAIIRLASFPTAETINTLSYLANHGEDYYIRSHAILALGECGIELSIPVIAKSMNDPNLLIHNSAKKALIKLVNKMGIERIQNYFTSDTSLDYKIIEKILDRLHQKKTRKPRQTEIEGERVQK